MTALSSEPSAEFHVSDDLARALLAEQHPDLAHLSLGARHEGWDNVMIRLGDDLALRMPRRATGGDLIGNEITWLHRLSRSWKFPAPVPVRTGEPGHGYPWRWTVVPWFDGHEAGTHPLNRDGAIAFARALAQIHQPAPDDAPFNPHRSTTLTERREQFVERLEAIEASSSGHGPGINRHALDAAWSQGAALPRDMGARWIHADLHGRNVLTRDGGELAAIIDWGDAAAGDPAMDLGQLFVLCHPDDVGASLAAYADQAGGPISEDTLVRSKAEAIHRLVMLATFGHPVHHTVAWTALGRLNFLTPVD